MPAPIHFGKRLAQLKDLKRLLGSGGGVRARRLGALNEYNPEGISIELVLMQLELYYREDLIGLIKWERQHPEISSSSAIDSPYVQKNLMCADDAALAEVISKYPISMVANPACVSAVARWSYANWYSRSAETRNYGEAMLAAIKPKGSSAPEMVSYSNEALAIAYGDLVKYSEGLRTCMTKHAELSDVLNFFPDCGDLEKYKISVARYMGDRGRYKFPPPPLVAKTVLLSLTGVVRSTLMRKVRLGRVALEQRRRLTKSSL